MTSEDRPTGRKENYVNPGDVRVFDKGDTSLVVAIGVWAKRQGTAIHIHLTGTKKFHPTVTNDLLRTIREFLPGA
jgi:hypothetical protein